MAQVLKPNAVRPGQIVWFAQVMRGREFRDRCKVKWIFTDEYRITLNNERSVDLVDSDWTMKCNDAEDWNGTNKNGCWLERCADQSEPEYGWSYEN